MKKLMFLIVLMTIILLTACKEDTGVNPSCPDIAGLDPFYYKQVDGYLAYITATTSEYELGLTLTVYADMECIVVPDSTRPMKNGKYPFITIWENDKVILYDYNSPFAPADLGIYGGNKKYYDYRDDDPSKERGTYGWCFRLKDLKTGQIYEHNGEIKYSKIRPNTEWWRL